MPSNQTMLYIIAATVGIFVFIIIAYVLLQKAMNRGTTKLVKQLRKGTEEKRFTSDVIYQKLYIIYASIPFLKRYVRKLRRKLEIIHIQDEYLTRKQTAQIITKAVLIITLVTIAVTIVAHDDILLLSILYLFEFFLIEVIMSGMVDKLDTKLLKQQIDFFAEIRHAYHEFNMVEEAIYEVSQKDEFEVSRQGDKIYEILISDDPETELEEYYDVAPNSYLKEFAGISYLTREFGDRTVNGASLYLKNLNNITEEMQLEILKREKLDYVFQSLSIIAMVPVLFLQPLKNWAVSNFAFTAQFYNGTAGLIVQILLVILTFVSFILTRKIKDSGAIKDEYKDPNKVWQMRLYRNPIIKKIVNLFIPNKKTKEYRKTVELLKDSASKQKMETVYVNRICVTILVFIISVLFFTQYHRVAKQYIYTNPTTDFDIMGKLSKTDEKKAIETTKDDNTYLKKYKGNTRIKQENIKAEMVESEFYQGASEASVDKAAQRVYKKLQKINLEYLKWFEFLISFAFAGIGYFVPIWLLMFQKVLRQLEMENEVMQFQTIILMLMKIERVNVEIILEWLERYANIFKEPITRCVNNYEAGGWEALEELKNEVSFEQFIRIVESLQAAVEKIPISEAFDELDNEREYYQAKRKESNERLISKKGLIGKVVGFTPMVGLFVGYLIIPLVLIGFSTITDTFANMSSMPTP